MAEHLEEMHGSDSDFAEILHAVNEQRTRLSTFVAEQRAKTAAISTGLQERLETLSAQLAEREQAIADKEQSYAEREQQIGERESELTAREEQLNQQNAEIDERQQSIESKEQALQTRDEDAAKREQQLNDQAGKIEKQQEEMLARAAELDEDVARVAEEREELEGQRNQLTQEIDQLAERREHLHKKLEELDAEREECSAAQKRTEEQRHRLAERMQARRKEITEQRAQLIASGGGASDEKLAELQDELNAAQQRAEQLEGELDQQKTRCQELESSGGGGADPKELKQLAQACRELERQTNADKKEIAELQQQLEQARADLEAGGSGEGGEGGGEYKQRYEMALADLREERDRITDLESQLASANVSGGAVADGGAMDWEAQKQRLLASLESDFDEGDEQQQQDKLTLQEALKTTDQAVQQKEREIEQLQQLLEQQSSNVGNMAVGAAAVAELLDKDELIQQERDNLQKIQEEWRDKLRQSEIDISLERAKLARDKAQLEEKLRELEDETAKQQKSNGAPQDEDKKGARGNWLSRMGLKGD